MSVIEELRRGEIVKVGNKLYGACQACGSIVRINKFIFGSLHICGETPAKQPPTAPDN